MTSGNVRAVYYIIEHPTRGILRGIDTRDSKPLPLYSVTARRNDPRIVRARSLPAARALITSFVETGVKDAKKLEIRRAPDFKPYCWECGGWLDRTYRREFGHRRDCPLVGGGD